MHRDDKCERHPEAHTLRMNQEAHGTILVKVSKIISR